MDPSSSALVEDLAARTGGVALAVDAVVRELRDAGVVEEGPDGWRATGPITVPPYVVDLFEERVEALPAGARAVLGAVVVADEALDRDDLVALAEGVPDPRPAVAAGLLRELPTGGWDVSHPLVAEAVERTIDETDRRALHAGLAARLAPLGDGVLDRYARHVVGAGSLVPDADAADVLARAGRRALRTNAADPAARWLSAAVVRATAGALPPRELGALLVDATDAWERCDELEAALDAVARAVDVLADEDPSAASRAAATAARLCWQVGRPEQHRVAQPGAGPRGDLPRPAAGALRGHRRPHAGRPARGGGGRRRLAPTGSRGGRGPARRSGPLPPGRGRRAAPRRSGEPAGRRGALAPDGCAGRPPRGGGGRCARGPRAPRSVGRATRQAEATLARLGPDTTVTGLSWRPVVARVHAAVATRVVGRRLGPDDRAGRALRRRRREPGVLDRVARCAAGRDGPGPHAAVEEARARTS